MKTFITLLSAICFFTIGASAQQKSEPYSGATATKESYRVVYQLDQASPDVIKKAIRNINNVLDDPRLKGKIQVEVVAYSGGTEALRKGSEFEEGIKKLNDRGVLVVQCLNTMRERKIEKSELYDFISFTPSANGELVIRAADGWVIIKP